MYLLRVTGDGGDAERLYDLDQVEDSVRRTVAEWARDEKPGHFGFGNGSYPCAKHKANPDGQADGCQECYEAENEALDKEIATWVQGELSSIMRDLETDGHTQLRIGGGPLEAPATITFRLDQDD
jgi:hypothetical protein